MDYSGTLSPDVSERELFGSRLVRRAGREGIVLLKNENVLPLSEGEKIALYGGGAVYTIKGGTGSGDVNERKSISIWEGLKEAGVSISSETWLREYQAEYDKQRSLWRDQILSETQGLSASAFFQVYTKNPFFRPEGKPLQTEAVDPAVKTAIYVISRVAGENADRKAVEGDYYLSKAELESLFFLGTHYENVVLLLNTGGPIGLSFLKEVPNIKAILYTSQLGMEGGNAIADILLGKESPSGKLTATWAEDYGDYCVASSGRSFLEDSYDEDIFVGYRYTDALGIEPVFAFGEGLSYASFSMTAEGICPDGCNARMKVRVKNTSSLFSGKEVAEIYGMPPAGRLVKERKKLLAFGKTRCLLPGEEEVLDLSFSFSDLSSFDEEKEAYCLEPGKYVICLGSSSRNVMPICSLLVKEEISSAPLTALKGEERVISERVFPPREESTWEGLPAFEIHSEDVFSSKGSAACCQEGIEAAGLPAALTCQAEKILEELNQDELISLVVGEISRAQGASGTLGNAGSKVPGAAGETSAALEKSHHIPGLTMADGPAGLRLKKVYQVQKDGQIVSSGLLDALEGGLFAPPKKEDPSLTNYYQYCTAIPVGTALAQTWNTPLVEEVGRMIRGEMDEMHVSLWLAPGLNIQRDPLCGRNFEYFSEDPLLSGRMAAAMVKGVQYLPGAGATIKHFACNNREENRKGVNSRLSQRALREIYLRGFEIAVKEGKPMAVMTSYNLVNGVHAANHKALCTDILRGEWGFSGFVMTDWTTTDPNGGSIPWKCIQAGNDLIMPGKEADVLDIKTALKEGFLSLEEVKKCAGRVLVAMLEGKGELQS